MRQTVFIKNLHVILNSLYAAHVFKFHRLNPNHKWYSIPIVQKLAIYCTLLTRVCKDVQKIRKSKLFDQFFCTKTTRSLSSMFFEGHFSGVVLNRTVLGGYFFRAGTKPRRLFEEQNRTEQNRTEQNRTEQNRTGQDRTGQDRTGQNRTEQNRTEQNRTEQNRTEQNRTEQNRTEQNRTEQNRTEQNRTEQNRTEQNRTEQNRTDTESKQTNK